MKEIQMLPPHLKVPKDKCFWNKKYKGWSPRTVYDELEIDFKPKRKFTAKMGRYPEDDRK